MKINLKIRKQNILFVFQTIMSILIPVLSYMGLTGKDITTWPKLFNLIIEATKNPYIVLMVIVSFWNALIDPTTPGISDSESILNKQEFEGESNILGK